MYEVIIIGARCAGAPTAMLLSRKGYRVLLVDRAEFPSDIPHGHFIHRIVSAGCPPVTTMTTDYGGIALTGAELMVDGVAMGYGPRRSALDKILVDAAGDDPPRDILQPGEYKAHIIGSAQNIRNLKAGLCISTLFVVRPSAVRERGAHLDAAARR